MTYEKLTVSDEAWQPISESELLRDFRRYGSGQASPAEMLEQLQAGQELRLASGLYRLAETKSDEAGLTWVRQLVSSTKDLRDAPPRLQGMGH